MIICHRDHVYSQCAQESGIFGICPKTVCFANLPLSPCCISKLIVCHRKICRNQFLFYFIGKIIRHVIICRLPRTPILIQTDIPDKIQTDACRIGCFFPDHILIRIRHILLLPAIHNPQNMHTVSGKPIPQIRVLISVFQLCIQTLQHTAPILRFNPSHKGFIHRIFLKKLSGGSP